MGLSPINPTPIQGLGGVGFQGLGCRVGVLGLRVMGSGSGCRTLNLELRYVEGFEGVMRFRIRV